MPLVTVYDTIQIISVKVYFFMFFRLVKLLFLAIATTFVGYYVALADNEKAQNAGASDSEKKNVTKKVAYKRRFNGGILLLTAEEIVLQTKEKLVLSDIKASFSKGSRDTTIECNTCNLDLKDKKAYLHGNVIIKSMDVTCCTEGAVVDFMAQTITGSAKVTGTGARGSFISNGFSVDKEGVIKLKNIAVKGKK